MRSRRDDALIGVSCGHRVPRVPVAAGQGNVYWCETCGEHRRSGGKTTGEHGHAYLFQLRELVQGLEVEVVEPLPSHGSRLLEALGVRA